MPRHPKLVRFLGDRIDTLATELGFRDDQIQRREFRAEKSDDHVVRLLAEWTFSIFAAQQSHFKGLSPL